jgi:hypothetical protein
MPSPLTWSTPPSGAETAVDVGTGFTYVSKAGDYWFALTDDNNNTGGTLPIVRYATDPAGPWSTATIPAQPSGYTSSAALTSMHGVVHGDGYYAFAVRYSTLLGDVTHRILYATDPGGTWSDHQYDSTEYHWISDFIHDGSTFIAVGRKRVGNPQPAFISTCATPGGTWAFNTSAATTGYDISTLSGSGSYWEIGSIDFDGTTYVTSATARSSSANTYTARYSTALTSGWAEPSGPPTADYIELVRVHPNGYWTGTNDATTTIHYAADPSGTWSSVSLSSVAKYVDNVGYDGGAWVATGGKDVSGFTQPAMFYLVGSGSPDGTYTEITGTTFSAVNGQEVYGIAVESGLWVAASSYYGQVRYSRVQSPSAGRSPRLRVRQTPYL